MDNGRCLVLTGYDAKMSGVGDLMAKTHRAYADQHGFAFDVVREYEPGTNPSWQKVRNIFDRLYSYDSILWLDADTLVTNYTIDFRDIQKDMKGLIFSVGWSGGPAMRRFSAGNFIVVKSPDAYLVLTETMKLTHWANKPMWEQSAMWELVDTRPDLQGAFHVLPRRVLNAVPRDIQPTIDPWRPGDFLCHLTGISNENRIRLFPRFNALARGLVQK